MVINTDLLNVAISVLLPILVALVTRQFAAGWVKSVSLLALAAVTGTLTSIQASGGTFDLTQAVVSTVISFVVAVASHFGLLKPSGITGSEGALQTLVPNGIG